MSRPSPYTYSLAEQFIAAMEGFDLPPLLVIEVEIEAVKPQPQVGLALLLWTLAGHQ